MFHLRYYLFTAIVAITLVVVVLAAIGMLAYVVWYYVVAGWFARTGKSGARVLRKHHSVVPESDSVLATDAYCVVFAMEKREREFSVPEQVYAEINEGDVGWLTYRGNLFRSFVRDPKLEHLRINR